MSIPRSNLLSDRSLAFATQHSLERSARMHLAGRRSAVVGARPLRNRLQRQGMHMTNSSASSSGGASRSFSASSFLPRNFFSSSSAGSSNSSKTARAAAFFLDAKAACKGKRCALGKNGSGIVSAPESCGEDSFFVSPSIVGVADGVGGWNENGVDPGEISRSLMRNASLFVKKNADANVEVTTSNVLAYGYKQALLDDNVEAGSTTACIVRVKESDAGTPILEYSNLGDSGFVIIRDNAVVFRSKFQVSPWRSLCFICFFFFFDGNCSLTDDDCGVCAVLWTRAVPARKDSSALQELRRDRKSSKRCT